ncbi:hypothetical protein LSUB1_G000099 [Lachnellula subtilissima]|uniref:Rhodopsin domain-containing protein n=1 Tax=Lachnellula subtilissima TaxID=602034 RepID=A0A8H8S3F5_9HELO|nr:hypothetical protein LSUB1_G000099 [Lachnellula subtilissima]
MTLFGITGGNENDPYFSYGPLLNRVGICMMCLSGIAVTLRFLTRRIARQPIKLDDYLIIAGLLLSWSGSIIQFIEAEIKQFLILIYASQIVYILAVATIKFSIIAFIRRVFDVSTTKLPTYIIVSIIMSWLIALELVAIFACHPIRGYWDKTIPSKCINTTNFYYGIGIPNLITDVMLIIFPLPMVWKLHMPLSQKIAVSGIFALGGFIVAVSFIHIFTVDSIGKNPDISWEIVPDALWNGIECNIGTVLACLSSMRPLLRFIIGQKLKSTVVKGSSIESQSGNHLHSHQWSNIKRTNQLTISSFSRLHDADEGDEGDDEGPKMRHRDIELGQVRTQTRITARA